MAPLDPITLIISAIDRTASVVGGVQNRISRMVSVVSSDLGKLTQQLTTVDGWYDLLINQNIQLQQQLLSTQATMVATNKILQNGLEVKDPAAAIKALEGPVNSAIERIRQGSLELVGVTSAELVPIFQIIAGQASQIGASLDDVADLTLDTSAALGTLGIPLFQANQELTSILTNSIDVNSVLAKSLNLTNAQVKG